uniref:WAP domain-containing protein n=1 Tax=Sus scrofa TaxID=9823 RepID=A0A8D1AP28_PIG
DQCQVDSQCPGQLKCCRNGCGKKLISIHEDVETSLPKKKGPCLSYILRWALSKRKDIAMRSTWGRSHGNQNVFEVHPQCSDLCSQRNRIEPTFSWILVRFVAAEPRQELPVSSFLEKLLA